MTAPTELHREKTDGVGGLARLILDVALPRLARHGGQVLEALQSFSPRESGNLYRRLATVPGVEGLAVLSAVAPSERLSVLDQFNPPEGDRQVLSAICDHLGNVEDEDSPSAQLVRMVPDAADLHRDIESDEAIEAETATAERWTGELRKLARSVENWSDDDEAVQALERLVDEALHKGLPLPVAFWKKAAHRVQSLERTERTLGVLRRLARILARLGEVGAALELHEHLLGIYEALGDKHGWAITLGYIARIRADKGQVDAALRLHDEKLAIVKALGDQRSRAVTLGDIARIRAAKGDVDAALELHQEAQAVFEALGDQEGIANTLWSIAQIELGRQKYQEAFDHLSTSYGVLLKLGRLDGICMVGLDLGRLLCAAGQREKGLEILARSRDGFTKLGQTQKAQQTQALIDQISEAP